MLVHFTIEDGCIPVTQQARQNLLSEYLGILRDHDVNAEARIRDAIRQHLDTNTQFTAAWIACDGPRSWREAFRPIYDALAEVATDEQAAYEEAGKFLGLLVWNEALRHPERWHFTEYPKLDTDYMVKHYFAMDGHICARVKMRQADDARRHGDEQRAIDLETAARELQARWLGRRP
jgi:hypothetical protein